MSNFEADAPEQNDDGQSESQRGAATVEKVVVTAHDVVDRVAEEAHATIDKAGDRSAELHSQAIERVDRLASSTRPLIADQPFVAVGLAALVGLFTGLILAAGRPRVIYLRREP